MLVFMCLQEQGRLISCFTSVCCTPKLSPHGELTLLHERDFGTIFVTPLPQANLHSLSRVTTIQMNTHSSWFVS